ncbi:MAG: hypothetical protein JW874_15430 [Spirochaetales bacterium]|nr:hypothetical protein [Spirochaetales bacterium]
MNGGDDNFSDYDVLAAAEGYIYDPGNSIRHIEWDMMTSTVFGYPALCIRRKSGKSENIPGRDQYSERRNNARLSRACYSIIRIICPLLF